MRAAIERLRYVPNLTAGSLASNRSRIVAVIVPTINSSIFSDTIDGLAQALASHRYQLLLGQTNYRLEEESALVQAFLGRRVDGLVLTGVNHARGVRSSMLRAGIPVVETWDLSDATDRHAGGLLEPCGRASLRRAICWARATRGWASSAARTIDRWRDCRGFAKRRAKRAPVKSPARSWPSPSSPADAGEALAELMAAAAPPRAIFCSNDMLAAGALFECARRRIAVPRRPGDHGFCRPADRRQHRAPPDLDAGAGQRDGASRRRRCCWPTWQGEAARERIVNLGFAVVERDSA